MWFENCIFCFLFDSSCDSIYISTTNVQFAIKMNATRPIKSFYYPDVYSCLTSQMLKICFIFFYVGPKIFFDDNYSAKCIQVVTPFLFKYSKYAIYLLLLVFKFLSSWLLRKNINARGFTVTIQKHIFLIKQVFLNEMYANRLSLGVVHECYIMQNIFCLNEWKSLKQISSFITIIIKHQQLVTLYKNVYCCRTSIQLNVFVMSHLFLMYWIRKNNLVCHLL